MVRAFYTCLPLVKSKKKRSNMSNFKVSYAKFLDEMIYGLAFQTVSVDLGSLTQYHMLFEILDLSFQIFPWVLLRLSYIDLH